VVLRERGVALRERGHHGQVFLAVVADRERVARRAGREEAVHLAAVDLLEHRREVVLRVGVVAALRVVADRPGLGGLRRRVTEGESLLLAVGAGQPPEEVVERAVLHHQHHHRVEGCVLARRVRLGTGGGDRRFVRLLAVRRAAREAEGPHGRSSDEEFPTVE